MPRRIQMRRDRPWRADNPDAVKVDRSTAYGNPFRVGDTLRWKDGNPAFVVRDRAHAVDLYRTWHRAGVDSDFEGIGSPPSLLPLAGRDLACWCPPDDVCHVDVTLELANGDPA